MFNTVSQSYNSNLNINAVSGMLIKNHKDSFIIRFQRDSQRAKELLTIEPKYDCKPAVVLQILILPDNWFMAEVVLEKHFKPEGENNIR